MTGLIETLSDEAKAVLGSQFGLIGSKATLTLHLVENVPTPTYRAALDELVTAGALSKAPFNRFGEIYKPLIDTAPFYRWMMQNLDNPKVKFQLMEPKYHVDHNLPEHPQTP